MSEALANALTPIFVGLLLGFYAGRRGLIDNVNVRSLIVLVMNITVPSALFSIIVQSSWTVLWGHLPTALVITLTFAATYLACFVWARRYLNMPISDGAVVALTVGFPNSAAVALPLLPGVFGPEAAIPAELSIAVGSITISPVTLALLDLSSKSADPKISAGALARGVLRAFRNPIVWSPVLALFCVFLGLHLPSYGMATLRTLGSAANGSALLLTGVVLSAQRFHVDGPVVWTTLAKLIVQPVLAIAISLLFRLSLDQTREIALISAIPGGFFGLVFGKSFNSAPAAASSSLISSHALSLITLPVWTLILSMLA